MPPAVSISNMPSAEARHSPRVSDEDVAAGEDDGEAVHPFAHGAVLERGRAGRARRHRAAGEGAEISRHRRKPSADLHERVLHLLQRHARADANAISFDRHRVQQFGAQARRRRRALRRRSATIARRRPERVAVAQAGRHFVDRTRPQRRRSRGRRENAPRLRGTGRSARDLDRARSQVWTGAWRWRAIARGHLVPPVPFDTTRL